MKTLSLALASLVLLAACGTKGQLVLPPGPAPEPLLGRSKPATPPPSTSRPTSESTSPAAPVDSSTPAPARP